MLKPIFIIACLLCSTLLFSQERDTLFTLCGEGRINPYYYPDLNYKNNFWDIKQHFKSAYPTSQFQILNNNTGIIIIQFNVNCNGETGNFVLQQCDFNYQPTIINQDIEDYFLNKSKTLFNWIPAKDEEGNNVNSHKFLSFRIKEGNLLEILPK